MEHPGLYDFPMMGSFYFPSVVLSSGLSQTTAWAPAQAPRADIHAIRAAPKCRLNASCVPQHAEPKPEAEP